MANINTISTYPKSIDEEPYNDGQPRLILDYVVSDEYPAEGDMLLFTFLIMFPGADLNMLRPKRDSATINIVKSRMKPVSRSLWRGTRFYAEDYDHRLEDIFFIQRVNTAWETEVERFCIRHRFVPEASQLKTMLIYTFGRHHSGGLLADCGFTFNDSYDGSVLFPLEKKGPDGAPHVYSLGRASLRAVVAALKFKEWWREGWERIIVATSGQTAYHASKNRRQPGYLQDLSCSLSQVLGEYAESGCEVSFTGIPESENVCATHLKFTTSLPAARQEYTDKPWEAKSVEDTRAPSAQ